jgi:hypothetical protein
VIVLEGSPGAGKTTLLGHLLAALPERLLVFPEAQPPRGVDDDARIVRALLAQDAGRVTAAATVAAAAPDAVIASDRCYLGVLAYRYALARLGRTGWAQFHHALTVSEELGLLAAHAGHTVIVLCLDAVESVRRRAAHADDQRYGIWFDHGFLAAYNDFWGQLDRWVSVGAGWILADAAVTTGWSAVTAALPSAVVTAAPVARDGTGSGSLACGNGCATPRSPVVTASGTATQLFTSAVHRQYGDGPVVCRRGAGDIAADWVARRTP